VVALSADELRRTVEDHLEHLGVDVLDVVDLRMPGFPEPVDRSPDEPMEALASMQQEGLIRHLGVSNVTTQTFADAKAIAPVVCVQNHYDVAHRHDDPLVDVLARAGIPFVACSPLGGFPPIRAPGLARVAAVLETTETEVALAWLLARSPNILAIPSTREVAHLEQNLEAGARVLGPVELEELDRIGGIVVPGAEP
jgi:aryl-alcohol dehydrogenase-like predicted oxidoreductase